MICRNDDAFLRILVEVLLLEGRRIERVEELADLAQLQLDGIARLSSIGVFERRFHAP
jgi:hypothetical protein